MTFTVRYDTSKLKGKNVLLALFRVRKNHYLVWGNTVHTVMYQQILRLHQVKQCF